MSNKLSKKKEDKTHYKKKQIMIDVILRVAKTGEYGALYKDLSPNDMLAVMLVFKDIFDRAMPGMKEAAVTDRDKADFKLSENFIEHILLPTIDSAMVAFYGESFGGGADKTVN